MRLPRILASLFATAGLVLADVSFSVPVAGQSYPGGTPIQITWRDSGTAPLLSALTVYTLVLYSGSNASPVSSTDRDVKNQTNGS